MTSFNPNQFYKRINNLKNQQLKKVFLSIPLNSTLDNKKQLALVKLSNNVITFINEEKLLNSLLVPLSKLDIGLVLSISKRGREIYDYYHNKGLFNSVKHINLAISRKSVDVYTYPTLNNQSILVIDDIFCTGLTLSKLANIYRKNNSLTCAFLFGPECIINEFSSKYTKVKLYYSWSFEDDPRVYPVDFTDINTLRELIIKYGYEGTELIQRVFKMSAKEAGEILVS